MRHAKSKNFFRSFMLIMAAALFASVAPNYLLAKDSDEDKPPKKPKAKISVKPSKGSAPFATVFDGGGSKGEDLDYIWDFGDGTFEEDGQIVRHMFVNPGSYVVTLTIEDSYGQQATATKKITVDDKKLPITVTQFKFSYDLFGDRNPAARIQFRVWGAKDIGPGSILAIKIGGNHVGYLPGEDFDSSDPFAIKLDDGGLFVGLAENADEVRVQRMPDGEIRGLITNDFLEDSFDQRIDFGKNKGVGSSVFTIYERAFDGTWNVYSTTFAYSFRVKKRSFDGEAEDAAISGALTDRDPTSEEFMTQKEKEKAALERKKSRERIQKEKKEARVQMQAERAATRKRQAEERKRARMEKRKQRQEAKNNPQNDGGTGGDTSGGTGGGAENRNAFAEDLF